jgi:hypothetical protein
MFHELMSRDREDGLATGQPRGTAGLDPRRASTVRRRIRHARTPGRTVISAVAVTPGRDEISWLSLEQKKGPSASKIKIITWCLGATLDGGDRPPLVNYDT